MAKATIKATPAIQNMAQAAADAGMPRDQTEQFIRAGYVPLTGMLPFHAAARQADKTGGPEWIALGGKRGPGKSHTVMAQIGLDDCHRCPDLKVLFLRKIMKSAAESFDDVVRRVFKFTEYEQTNNGLRFPNGSRIVIGGFKDEKDIEKYLGIEYDIIAIEECTQVSESKKDKLRGSLRTSKSNWRPRIYMSTNADGIGLLWFRKMFVEPQREKRENRTRFYDVTHIDNPFINAEYQEWLDGLTGSLRKAWRDGDWDAFAGQAFPEWNRDAHVIKPFEIPTHWVKWRATDWGKASPYCTLWMAIDPDTRRMFVYREHYAAGLTDMAQAQSIRDMTPPNEQIAIHYADPALWEQKSRDGEVFSTADEYRKHGIVLTKAENARVAGKRKISNALAILPDGLPRLQIFENCPRLIEQLGTLASDERNPEDVDTEQEDHAYDTLRYALTNERRLEPKKPPTFRHPLSGVKGI